MLPTQFRQDALGDSTTVLVSPDADLCFLPWPALPDPHSDSYLLRHYTFGIVPSARQLVQKQA